MRTLCALTFCAVASLLTPALSRAGSSDLENAPPPEGPVRAPTGEWAVLDILTDGVTALQEGDVITVASSSEPFGEHARQVMLRQVNREISEVRRQLAGEGALPQRAKTHQTRLYARRGAVETPARIEAHLPAESFPLTLPMEAGIYFRARAGGDGRITRLEVLYSRYPDFNPAFVSFVKENLVAVNVSEPGAPAEFYGYFGLGGPHLEPWYFTMGGSRPGDEVPEG